MNIVLIGSFRKDREKLKQTFSELQSRYTLLSPKAVDFVDPEASFVKNRLELERSPFNIQQEVLRQIDLADAVWLFAPGGYVGVSAAFEIGYCAATRKVVVTNEDLQDEMLTSMVRRVESIADLERTALGGPSKTAAEGNDEKNTTKITEVKIYADGGSRGNPGPSASGFVVVDMNENILHTAGIYLGITTNNQAEYQALKLGLEYVLHTFGAQKVHVYMDSLLVINQMKSIFKVRNRDLWPVHDAITQLQNKFQSVSFNHIPRELNRLADAEVNRCLDAEQHS